MLCRLTGDGRYRKLAAAARAEKGTARDVMMGKLVPEVQTLAQRKQARVEEIRSGVDLLREELARYGRAHGGAFWLYGSAATGKLHFDSDVDILVDFDEAGVVAALDFVEDACARLRLKADVQPLTWCKAHFIERIKPEAQVLP